MTAVNYSEEISKLRTEIKILEEIIRTVDKLNKQHQCMTTVALDKAEKAVDMRLMGMNEFRQQLNEQANTFATVARLDQLRDGYNMLLQQVREKFDEQLKSNAVRSETLIAANAVKSELASDTNAARLTKQENTIANLQGRMYVLGLVLLFLQSLLFWYLNTHFK